MKYPLAGLLAILMAAKIFGQPAAAPGAAASTAAASTTAQPAGSAAATPVAAPSQPTAGAPASGTPPAADPAAAQPNGARQGQARGPARGNAINNRDPIHDAYYKLGPDSKLMDGVPKGHWVGPKYVTSEVFPGTQHTYYVYVPAQYDPAKPTAVMIHNDGAAMMREPGDIQAQNVLDNLIYRREIPVMLGVFINPGRRPDQPEPTPSEWGDRTSNRPVEYNAPNEKYGRVIVEEIMPDLKKEFNISPDPELHGIMGASSGGCAAFAVAWFRPNDFRKVITFVGSFTNLQGEYIYPELVAESDKKPIRIFMQDGRNDNRNVDPKMDWFYQNVRLMEALTKKGYDVNYSWGMNNHGQKMGGAIYPEMMRWLWRDQPVSTDPADTVEKALRPAVAQAAEAPAVTAATTSDAAAKP